MNDPGADRNPFRAFPVFIPVGGEHKKCVFTPGVHGSLPLIHNSGISVNPWGNADGSVFVPGLFTGSLGWEMLTIKASVLYLAYFFLYGCVM